MVAFTALGGPQLQIIHCKMIYKYLTFIITDFGSGEVFVLSERNSTMKTLNSLGAEGWKVVGCEFTGTKVPGEHLKSSAIWIAVKEEQDR